MTSDQIDAVLAVMYEVPRDERETIAMRGASEKFWRVTTNDPVEARAIMRKGHEPTNAVGSSLEFRLPEYSVSWRGPTKRTVSEEQKAAAAERIREYHRGRAKGETEDQ